MIKKIIPYNFLLYRQKITFREEGLLFILLFFILCTPLSFFHFNIAQAQHTAPESDQVQLSENTHVSLSSAEQAWLKAHPVITLAGAIIPPLDSYNEVTGRPEGVGPDYTDLIGEMLGIKFEYTSGSWRKILSMTEEKKVDGIRLLIKNTKREEYLQFSKPYTTIEYGIVTRKDSIYASLGKLSHKRVGVMDAGHAQHYLPNHYPEIKLVLYSKNEDSFRALINGDIDAIVSAVPNISHFVEKLFITKLELSAFIPEMSTNLHVGIRKDWPQFVTILNKAIDAISDEIHRKIKRKWIAYENEDEERHLSLSPEEQSWLTQNHTVSVRIANFPPYMILGENEISGIVIDYLNLIAKRSGVTFEFVIETRSWQEALESLMNLQGPDMIASISPTAERIPYMDFSEPYFVSPQMIFSRTKDQIITRIDDLNGRTLAVPRGTLVQKKVEVEYPDISLLLYDTDLESIEAVSMGKADAYIGNLVYTSHVILLRGINNLQVAAPAPFGDDAYTFGIRKDWPELSSIINKGLSTISFQEQLAIRSKYLSVRYEHGIQRIDVVKWVLVVVGGASCILLLFVFWNRSLKREVKARTAELDASNKSLTAEVDEREAAEQTLLEKVLEERTLIDSVTDSLFLMNTDGTIIIGNQGLADRFGKQVSQLTGLNAYDILPEDVAGKRREYVGKVITSGRELTFIDERSGRITENRLFPLKDHQGTVVKLAVFSRDITDERHAQQQIVENEARFRATFEQAAVGIAHVSPAGRFLRINQKFCDIVGYSQEQMLELGFQQLTHPDDLERDLRYTNQLLAGEADTFSMEKRYFRKNDEIIWINLTVALVRDNTGNPDYFVAVVEDIGERKQAEEQVQQYQERLKALASQLTLAEEKERDRIAADLHDRIGQNLAFSRIQLAIAKKYVSEDKLTAILDEISQALFETIQETRDLVFDLSSPLLHELGLAAAISNWLKEQVEKKYGLNTEFSDNGREVEIQDDVKIILFRNIRELLTNVIKHAQASNVVITLDRQDTEVKVIVRDDGVGFIADEKILFGRAGSEFGLFSIRERMEDMRGSFDVASEPGKGCTATLTAPITA